MLINAMEVTGIEGTYRSTCESTMEVLRKNKDSLMAVLEAFVYDPLLAWRLIENKPKVQFPINVLIFRVYIHFTLYCIIKAYLLTDNSRNLLSHKKTQLLNLSNEIFQLKFSYHFLFFLFLKLKQSCVFIIRYLKLKYALLLKLNFLETRFNIFPINILRYFFFFYLVYKNGLIGTKITVLKLSKVTLIKLSTL